MPMTDNPQVWIVDDDQQVRQSLAWLLGSVGIDAQGYADAQRFLEAYSPKTPGCLLLDVRMPGMGGLALQKHLKTLDPCLPVILLTGHGDVAMAVSAMKAGAFDFFEKPFNDQQLIDCIQRALNENQHAILQASQYNELVERYACLTPREQEVLSLLLKGEPAKVIADRLFISPKTVDVHRSKVMSKMQADSLADLVRLCQPLELI